MAKLKDILEEKMPELQESRTAVTSFNYSSSVLSILAKVYGFPLISLLQASIIFIPFFLQVSI